MTDLLHSEEKDKTNPMVFYIFAELVLSFSLTTILFHDFSAPWIGRTLGWAFETSGWYYLLAVTLCIIFVVYIVCSHSGPVELGLEQPKPEFSLLSWAAVLFAVGISIDLMFFSAAEPVTRYMQPPEGAGQTIEAAHQTMVWTLFHYGLTGWLMYALMGMVLEYFSYRYSLPFIIRLALCPISGKRINGLIGHSVDIAVVIGAIFGIVATLGIGVVQLNYGLSILFDIPDSVVAKATPIALLVIIATISVTSGIDEGIRVLLELNVALVLGLILFVLLMGDTSFLLNALVLDVGDYVNRFMGMTPNSFVLDHPVEWVNSWMFFFWAWRVVRSPLVGLFLVRISRGRAVRQFVLGTLIIPLIFTLLRLSVFGNSALYEIIHGGVAFIKEAMVYPERGFYSLLAQYPAFTFSASIAAITGLPFYVTSADSGALMSGSFTLQPEDISSDASGWSYIFWSMATGLLTLGMLMANGISALQSTTMIIGLPFSFVIFLVMAGLCRSLKVEDYRHGSANRDTVPRPLGLQDHLSWKKHFSCLVNYPGTRYTKQMTEMVCYPAVEEMAQELRLRDAYAELKNSPPKEGQQSGHLDLLVYMGKEQDFIYQIWPQQYSVPGFTYHACGGKSTYCRLETFLLEDSQGNDLTGHNKEQMIIGILDQYEWHLDLTHFHREAPGHSAMFPGA